MISFAANASQCIVNGEETPKTAPSPLDFFTLPEEHRATAIVNMHKNGKDRSCSFGDILTDRLTDRHTDTQTRTHTDVLIAILRRRSRGRSNKQINTDKINF